MELPHPALSYEECDCHKLAFILNSWKQQTLYTSKQIGFHVRNEAVCMWEGCPVHYTASSL